MINPIASLSGGGFLVFYAIVSGVTLLLCRRYVLSKDATRSMTAPAIPEKVDSYEIAYMQGGKNEFTRVVIVGLAERGYLQTTSEKPMFSSSEKKHIQQTDVRPRSGVLSQVEQTVYDWFSTARTAEEVFSGDLPDRVGSYGFHYEEQLQQKHLLSDGTAEAVSWNVGLIGGAAIVGIGGLRLLVGLDRGQPIGFLAAMVVVSFIALIFICSSERLTVRGKAYLEQLKRAPDALDYSTGSHYALAAAVLGVAGLAGTPYEDFGHLFKNSQSSSTGGCGVGGGDGGCGGCGGCG